VSSIIKSYYKWNLSNGPVREITTGIATVDTSVGIDTTQVLFLNTNPVFYVLAPSPPSTFPAGAFCISFNQTNQSGTTSGNAITFIQTNNNLIYMPAITFSCWIRPNISYSSDSRYYIANFSAESSIGSIDFYISGVNQRLFLLINEDGLNYKYSSSQIPNNQWTHVAFTFSSFLNNGFIYVNGVKNETQELTGYSGKVINIFYHLLISIKYGSNNGQSGMKGFRGYMNYINVFDKALTDDDILYLYNNPSYSSSSSGLITIGIENENGYINSDSISLWPDGGKGFVGVNTKTPEYPLDVSGAINTNTNAVINNITVGRGANNYSNNTAIGFQTIISVPPGLTSPQGDFNTAVGYQTLRHNTTGYSNTAIGFQALINNTSGLRNVALGLRAHNTNTTGSYNVAVGYEAGSNGSFTGNSNNTFLGAYANINGNFNNSTAVGSGAIITESNQIKLGTNNESVYVGTNLLLKGTDTNCYIKNTTAHNLYFGTLGLDYMWIDSNGMLTINKSTGTLLTLKNTLSGASLNETDIDFYAGTFLMGRIAVNNRATSTWSSSMSFFVAVNQLYEAIRITGVNQDVSNCCDVKIYGNVEATRFRAYSDSNGYYGISTISSHLTFTAGQNTTDASNNPHMKLSSTGNLSITGALSAGASTLASATVSGTTNVGLNCKIYSNGNDAYVQNINTNDLGLLYLQSNVTTTGTTKGIMIDKNGNVGINVGPNASYALDVSGNVEATSYNATSDYRIKKNLVPLDLTFNVDLLKPVSYVLKHDNDARLNIGFIAHEVQEVYPFLVNGVKDGSFNQSINYNGFIGILTKEIQVLKKRVSDQKMQISDQEERLASQETKALEQEARLAEQQTQISDQDQRIQALEKMVFDLINK
jgi:hypothetical protein